MKEAERQGLLGEQICEDAMCEHNPVLARLWILLLFCAVAVLQGVLWNFYTPIEESAKAVYGWDDDFIADSANAASVAFIATVALWSVAVDVYGPRRICIASAILLVVSALLRCVPVPDGNHRAMVVASMVMTGVVGPPVMLCAPIVSAAWFPVNQRTTATAVMMTMNDVGKSVGFAVGPLMVFDNDPVEAQRSQIRQVYYIEALLCAVALCGIMYYFPNQPLSSPSQSATDVEDLRQESDTGSAVQDWGTLVTWPQGWILFLCTGVPVGVAQGWSMELDMNLLEAFGLSEDGADFIGFWQAPAGILVGVLFAFLSDRFPGNLKLLILILYAMAVLMFLWIVVCGNGEVQEDPFLLYFACIFGAACIDGSIPLYTELAIEATYPIGAGITGGFMQLLVMLVQCVFMFVPIDQLGTQWMNWTLLISSATCTFCLFLWEAKYERLKVDRMPTSGVVWSQLKGPCGCDSGNCCVEPLPANSDK